MREAAESIGRRQDVLRVLKSATAPMRINEIADILDLHPNTVRFHLDTLIEDGQVQRAQAATTAPGRPAQLFEVVPGMDRSGPRHYRVLAEVLINSLTARPNASKRAVEAGRTWGYRQAQEHAGSRSTSPVTKLLDLLDEMGFAPKLRKRSGQSQIALQHCPFLELAEDESRIVCAVHLGIMQGAMQEWGSQATIDRLEPFAEPDRCLAHLVSTGGSK